MSPFSGPVFRFLFVSAAALALGGSGAAQGIHPAGVRSALGFEGTGGLGGDFDWEIRDGERFVFDTTSTVLVGGPGFAPTRQQLAQNGVIDVRNLRIGHGAELVVQGPNPVTILAAGTVIINGTIDVSGISNPGVTSINTTNIPEPGSPGVAGSGAGGTGSPLTNASSPSGTAGFGAFNVPDGGGAGGETGWNATNPIVDARRGAGGGGGVFGHDQPAPAGATGTFDQRLIGLDAEPGFVNTSCIVPPPAPGTNCTAQHNPPAKGALSGISPPQGGAKGPSPFKDADPGNDFFGERWNGAAVITGELGRLWAGSGGGGGGDASFTNGQPFPMVPFDPAGDEKGSGGASGGGGLRILAIGDIVFTSSGRILATGGHGGGGENTNFLDRVGAGSGGGSGGHVVLESASSIDMIQVAPGAGVLAIAALGGEGGAGRGDQGGASLGVSGSFPKPPNLDACPPGHPTVGPNACIGHIDGTGGDGGPGVIQLHTPRGLSGGDILLPPGKTLADMCQPVPVYTTATEWLLPSIGPFKKLKSTAAPLERERLIGLLRFRRD